MVTLVHSTVWSQHVPIEPLALLLRSISTRLSFERVQLNLPYRPSLPAKVLILLLDLHCRGLNWNASIEAPALYTDEF